jgi:hypothetical protein
MVLVTNTINVNTGDKISEIRQGPRVLSRVGCRQGYKDEYLRSLNWQRKKNSFFSYQAIVRLGFEPNSLFSYTASQKQYVHIICFYTSPLPETTQYTETTTKQIG